MAVASHDAIVVGAGHNGLVCAAYLAAAGLRVKIVERRLVVGGAAATEEFHPGFRNSVAAYTVGLLQPKVVRDLDLHRHGLRIVPRRLANFLPLPDGRHLKSGGPPGATQAEVAKFSARDAARLPEYLRRLEAMADVLRDLVLRTPPNVASGRAAWPEIFEAAGVARRLSRLGIEGRRDLHALFTRSVGDLLDGWFESDPIKALLGFDGIVGTWASPYAPGTGYVQLHHVFGETEGRRGAWGHAIGGMGAISAAMAASCTERGVDIETGAAVRAVLVEDGRAVGVALEDGRALRAPVVAANVNPRLLFERLVDPAALDADFRTRMASWRCGSGVLRINLALSEAPRFACLREPGDHLTSGIVLAPSLAYMDRAWRDSTERGWSRRPIVEMLVPSTLDDSLAPPGRHVASLFCQHFAPALPDGRGWDEAREEAADLAVATVDEAAPGFAASVIARRTLTPLDLERDFGLVGGDIFHGAMGLDQLFSARPVLGHADHRMPISGLYLCGSGAHPGGGVTGAPGHNAAREILRDRRLGRLAKRRASS